MIARPRIKLDNRMPARGVLVEVKTFVSHLMEPGGRKDAKGNPIPRKILNKFACVVAGREVFCADLQPAIAANPYLSFKFKAQETGSVILTWTDDDGTTIVGEDYITVT
jgi:sulfur-oxidizing protein SoxZ